MIAEIFAMAENGVIGVNNGMPWHLPNDFKYFKKTTMGYPVVMGRKTWESIGGKPLPGRDNIVLSRCDISAANALKASGCKVFSSVDEVLKEMDGKDFFVIGGGTIYEAFLPMCDRLYVTRVHCEIDGDTYFCDPDLQGWSLISSEEGIVDEKNALPHTFEVYERR